MGGIPGVRNNPQQSSERDKNNDLVSLLNPREFSSPFAGRNQVETDRNASLATFDQFRPIIATRDLNINSLMQLLNNDPTEKRELSINALRNSPIARGNTALQRDLGIVGNKSLSELVRTKDKEDLASLQDLLGTFVQGGRLIGSQYQSQAAAAIRKRLSKISPSARTQAVILSAVGRLGAGAAGGPSAGGST